MKRYYKEDNFVVTASNTLSKYSDFSYLEYSIFHKSETALKNFSIKTSEIKELNDFNLYVISKDEERYQEINCTLI